MNPTLHTTAQSVLAHTSGGISISTEASDDATGRQYRGFMLPAYGVLLACLEK